MLKSNINKKIINRFSRYRQALLRLKNLGYKRVVSITLGKEVEVNSSQIRKDFSMFKITGNRKSGYDVDYLIKELGNILGKNRMHKLVLAGIGNIGAALINHYNSKEEGVEIIAGFDIDPLKLQKKYSIPVYALIKMEEFIKSHSIKTGVISVPAVSAQDVCDKMVSAGINGILNFAPVNLKSADDVFIQYVNIQNKLENIFYFSLN